MNYNNPELIDRLAAEYVLGTLRGAARRRFERLITIHQWIRVAVWSWEAQIGPMAGAVEENKPPGYLWEQIRASVDPSLVSEAKGKGHEKSNWTSWFWRGWSAAATMLSIVLVVYIAVFNAKDSAQDYVAVFNNELSQPLWLVAADLETGAVTFRSFNQTAQQVDQVFELWMLQGNNLPPKSLGLLPVSGGEVTTTVPPGLMAVLRKASGLAISLEPVGGSPTGLPTGPVLYQAQIHTL